MRRFTASILRRTVFCIAAQGGGRLPRRESSWTDGFLWFLIDSTISLAFHFFVVKAARLLILGSMLWPITVGIMSSIKMTIVIRSVAAKI
ncbi:hypothetical protein BG60_01615 [Caballeronia zhejiangensis]|uniref:Uncharacterized protein n=1 Tax=Caballeronia zhejiangensis TaxID=871203 RepID=A0A656QUX6_9BURK|nr:hypothetical protein BG60_01615 [Caballeronia zhejiangensis]